MELLGMLGTRVRANLETPYGLPLASFCGTLAYADDRGHEDGFVLSIREVPPDERGWPVAYFWLEPEEFERAEKRSGDIWVRYFTGVEIAIGPLT